MDAKLSAIAPDSPAAELLRLWCTLSLENPLPLYIFNPKLLINLEPSRLELKSSVQVIQSPETLQAAVSELESAGIATKVTLTKEQFLKLDESIVPADWPVIQERFFPSEGSDGSKDDFIAEVAKLFFCIWPQAGIGSLFEFYSERLYYHTRRLFHLLLKRRSAENVQQALKELLHRDDFYFFAISVEERSIGTLPPRQDWTKEHKEAAIKEDFQLATTLMTELEGQMESKPRLEFHWKAAKLSQATLDTNESLEKMLQLLDKFKADGKGPALNQGELAVMEIFKFGGVSAAPDRLTEAKSSLRRIILGFDSEYFPSTAPQWYRRALKAHAASVLINRICQPDFKPMSRPFFDAITELGTKQYLPFADALVAERDLFFLLSTEPDNQKKFLTTGWDSYMICARNVGVRNMTSTELRNLLMGALLPNFPLEDIEERLKALLDLAAQQYGKFTEEYIACLTDCTLALTQAPQQQRSVMQHALIQEAVHLARQVFGENSRKLMDVMCIYTSCANYTSESFEPTLVGAIKIGLHLKLVRNQQLCAALHLATRYFPTVKNDIKVVSGLLVEAEEIVQSNPSVNIPSPLHLASTMCRCSLLLAQQKPTEAVEMFNSVVPIYSPLRESDEDIATFIMMTSSFGQTLASDLSQTEAAIQILKNVASYIIEVIPLKMLRDPDGVLAELFTVAETITNLRDPKSAKALIEAGRAAVAQHRPDDSVRFEATLNSLIPDLDKKVAAQIRAEARKQHKEGFETQEPEPDDIDDFNFDGDDFDFGSQAESGDEAAESEADGSEEEESEAATSKTRTKANRAGREGLRMQGLLLIGGVATIFAAVGVVAAISFGRYAIRDSM